MHRASGLEITLILFRAGIRLRAKRWNHGVMMEQGRQVAEELRSRSADLVRRDLLVTRHFAQNLKADLRTKARASTESVTVPSVF